MRIVYILLALFIAAMPILAADEEKELRPLVFSPEFSDNIAPFLDWSRGPVSRVSIGKDPDAQSRNVLELIPASKDGADGQAIACLNDIGFLKPGHVYHISFESRLEPFENNEKMDVKNVYAFFNIGNPRLPKKEKTKWLKGFAPVVGKWKGSLLELRMPAGRRRETAQFKIGCLGNNFKLLIKDIRIRDATWMLEIQFHPRIIIAGEKQRVVFHCRMPEGCCSAAKLKIRLHGKKEDKEELVISPPEHLSKSFDAKEPGEMIISVSLSPGIPGFKPLKSQIILKAIQGASKEGIIK